MNTTEKKNKGKNSNIKVKILEVQDEAFRPLKHPEEPWEKSTGGKRDPPWPPDYQDRGEGGP